MYIFFLSNSVLFLITYTNYIHIIYTGEIIQMNSKGFTLLLLKTSKGETLRTGILRTAKIEVAWAG